MKLTEKQKETIHDIIDNKLKDFYGVLNNDSEKKKRLGQFYTPGKLIIMMLEKYETESLAGKTILDPTCGSGNLLIGCLCAGADIDKIFGNEYDIDAVNLCKERIKLAAEYLGLDFSKFNSWQIHRGNALQTRCLIEFGPEYEENYRTEAIDDLDYAQGKNKYGKSLTWQEENTALDIRSNNVEFFSLF